MHTVTRRRLAARLSAISAAALGASVSLAIPPVNADSSPVRDGSTSTLAAASCWEIKQNSPAAPSGVYWLQTPTLVAPDRFYCDQTSEGGGWVLIGRGRQGWGYLYTGQGDSATLASTTNGPAAFTPAALPASTIDGLLNGGRVDGLADGIRLVRAQTTDGAKWQEVRFHFASRDRWTWTLPAVHPLGTWSMTGTGSSGKVTVNGSGGTSNNFGTDNAYARIITQPTAADTWQAGWDFGSSVAGSTSATSYVWKTATSGARAIPFTQVFLRPTLMSSDLGYGTIGDEGTTAQTGRPMPDTRVLANQWGVTGLASGSSTIDNTEVRAIKQVGNRMIVGGNFATVQQDAAGTNAQNQPYLAAFDVATGSWLPDFRPTLDGQVNAVAALPNGDVVVGGTFTTVNGTPSPSIVALDPVTGAIDPSWHVHLEQHVANTALYVRGFDEHDNFLYVGGNFSHLSGGDAPTLQYARSAARVSLTDGTPDSTWRPVFNGNINALAASADGTRVYLAGRFTTVNGTSSSYFTVLSTEAGAPLVAGLNAPQFSNTRSRYQQAVIEAGGSVWEGGAEHMLFTYRPADLALLSTNIAWNKGDFQALTTRDGIVFGSCHCGQWVYAGAKTWPSPSGWTEADNLQYVGAWDAVTGQYLPQFVPAGVDTRNEFGGWSLSFDSNGVLWAGGAFVSATGQAGTRVWTGAFMRFPPADTTAPTAPTAPDVRFNTDNIRLAWSGSTDNSGKAVRYEVLENDRVVMSLGGTSVNLPLPTAVTRYFVRAIDKAGNRSPSTAVITVGP